MRVPGSSWAHCFVEWKLNRSRAAWLSREIQHWSRYVGVLPRYRDQGELLASFEMQFHALVSRLESEFLVKLHCAGTRLVGCELHHGTATFAAATNGPLNQLRAEAAASATGRNSDGFNQPSRATFVRQIRQKRELECTDQPSVSSITTSS